MSRTKIYDKIQSICNDKNINIIKFETIGKACLLQCSKGHIFDRCPSSIKDTLQCKDCKLEVEFLKIKDEITQLGGELLSTEYKNNTDNLIIKCDKGHIFDSNYYNIKNKNVWCGECKSFCMGEMICRNFLEELFDTKFPKYRADWLRNDEGFKLEFDGYCEYLGIAFEHNGTQHYKYIDHFGSEEQFNRLQYNDNQKIKICQERNIKLIIIPQLFQKTPLAKFKDVIKNELLKNNITIPERFETLEINRVKASRHKYCDEQLELAKEFAKNRSGELLSTEFIYAEDDLEWKCQHNHIFYNSLKNIKQGQWCKRCAGRKEFLDITYDLLYDLHYTQQLSITKISKLLKISRFALNRLFEEHNLKINVYQPFEITKDELHNLFINNNMSISDIATKFNCSSDTIAYYLKKFNIKKLNINRSKIIIDEKKLYELYVIDKKSMRQISEIYSVNLGVIRDRLTKLNIEIRSR